MRNTIQKELGLDFCLQFSAKTHSGKDEFLEALEKILAGYRFKVPEKKSVKKKSNQTRVKKGQQRKRSSNRNRKSGEGNEDKSPEKVSKTDNSEKKSNNSEKSSQRSGPRRKRRPGKRTDGPKEPMSKKPNS
jgi:hypothetical protein